MLYQSTQREQAGRYSSKIQSIFARAIKTSVRPAGAAAGRAGSPADKGVLWTA